MSRKLSKLEQFQDLYNPLSLYSRLRELNISKYDAVEIGKYYEEYFYNPIKEILTNATKKKS